MILWTFLVLILSFSCIKICWAINDKKISYSDPIFIRAGRNLSIPCMDLIDNITVVSLEWYCTGCQTSASRKKLQSNPIRLVHLENNVTTVWHDHHRAFMNDESYELQWNAIMYEDSGLYFCHVNKKRTSFNPISIIVEDVPDAPGRPFIIRFTSRSADLSWAPSKRNHNSLIINYIISIRKGEQSRWNDDNVLVTETNATSYTVQHLIPFTVYSFRLFAVNKIGRSPPGPESYYMITLREVPSGKPTFTYANNISTSAIRLEWKMPPLETLHGEFIAYRISYRPDGDLVYADKIIDIAEAEITSHLLTGLETFTSYHISIQVVNLEGAGPKEIVIVKTDEGVPGSPQHLLATDITDTSLVLTWREPSNPNGIILGYRVYYMYENYTDVMTVKNPSEIMEITLGDLNPFTTYKIWTKAFTWKNEGASSDFVTVRTDVSFPEAPTIVNVSCNSSSSIVLYWRKPLTFFNEISSYNIRLRKDNLDNVEERVFPAVLSNQEYRLGISNLTSQKLYLVQIQAVTQSILNKTKNYRSLFSKERKVFVGNNCEEDVAFKEEELSKIRIAILVGTSCSFAILLIVVTALIICRQVESAKIVPFHSVSSRKCAWETYYSFKDPPNPLIACPGWNDANDADSAIPVFLFPAHLSHLHADGNKGFRKEFEDLQLQSPVENFSATFALVPENREKNRYTNIIAYDHTRVPLASVNSDKKFSPEYINANFVDGFMRSKAYIATQGPLSATIVSFWKMVWEQNVKVIIMITNLVEGGRKKCDVYWPCEGEEQYGQFLVRLDKENELSTYTVRQFRMWEVKVSLQCKLASPINSSKNRCTKSHEKVRRVVQYHFTDWPDHGIPDHPLPILNFVRASSTPSIDGEAPVVVHCSAGVGRTGTYVVIDTMLKQVKAQNRLNISSYLRHIRTQRNFLVQTEEQYIFIHDVLLEALLSGETSVPSREFSRYLQELQAVEVNEAGFADCTRLEMQFKMVTNEGKLESQFEEGTKSCNAGKNRRIDLLPVDNFRVCLSGNSGISGSTYINASWFPGYHRIKEFIITQHPFSSTVMDFWQMVFDHSAQSIVLLAEALTDSRKEDYELRVQMICLRSSIKTMHACDIVRMIQIWLGNRNNGPTVVVDRFGGTEAATFIVLTTLLKQLEAENCVNVYSFAKLCHIRRPGIWKCLDDYMFLYLAINYLLTSNSGRTIVNQLSQVGNSNGYIRASRYDDHLFDTCCSDASDTFQHYSSKDPSVLMSSTLLLLPAEKIYDKNVHSNFQHEDTSHLFRNKIQQRAPPEGRESYFIPFS